MINWQNRRQRLIIISSLVLLLVVLAAAIFIFLKKPVSPQNNPSPVSSSTSKTNQIPESVAKWRAKETARLAKANHDQALYAQILTSKDASRCQEMQNLDGNNLCLLSLAVDLGDSSICDKISQPDFAAACRQKLTAPAAPVENKKSNHLNNLAK